MASIAELLASGESRAYHESGKCRVQFKVAPDVREQCSAVTIYGSDGREISMQTMHVSQVEQYVRQNGFDPSTNWG